MTWIPTIPPDGASLMAIYQRIYSLYPSEYGVEVEAIRAADGTSDKITAAHSLIPAAIEHAMSTFAMLITPDLPHTRRQQEMIAVTFSTLHAPKPLLVHQVIVLPLRNRGYLLAKLLGFPQVRPLSFSILRLFFRSIHHESCFSSGCDARLSYRYGSVRAPPP